MLGFFFVLWDSLLADYIFDHKHFLNLRPHFSPHYIDETSKENLSQFNKFLINPKSIINLQEVSLLTSSICDSF